MLLRLCALLLLSLPVSAIAGEYLVNKIDSVLNWGFWSILIASIAGGLVATFIKTEVDEKLTQPILAKLLSGSFLGFMACVSYSAYFPETVVLKLALPSFVLGCLGAPIVVFLLTYASDKNTYKKASKTLDKKLGLDEEV